MTQKLILNQKTKKMKVYMKMIKISLMILIRSSIFKKFNAINEKIDLIGFCILIVRAIFEQVVQSSRF